MTCCCFTIAAAAAVAAALPLSAQQETLTLAVVLRNLSGVTFLLDHP